MTPKNAPERPDGTTEAATAFEALARDLTASPDIESGRMFGSPGLKIGGKTFGMVVKGAVVVKLPASRVDALIAEGGATRFDPGHGRLMKEWASLTDPSASEVGAVVREALAYVRSLA